MDCIHEITKQLGKLLATSTIYETAAWGLTDQQDFLNLALKIETSLSPYNLLKAVNNIERKLGKEKIKKWGPRCIDVDILFYNDQIINTKKLTLPHPHIAERNFVLYPLEEIASDYLHPVYKKTISYLKETTKDDSDLWSFEDE